MADDLVTVVPFVAVVAHANPLRQLSVHALPHVLAFRTKIVAVTLTPSAQVLAAFVTLNDDPKNFLPIPLFHEKVKKNSNLISDGHVAKLTGPVLVTNALTVKKRTIWIVTWPHRQSVLLT